MSSDQESAAMTPSRPYLLRAFYEWIVDNSCTPYLVVNANFPEVKVPLQYVEAGKIILNIAEVAVKNLFIDNEAISFSARFSGKALAVYIPIDAALAVYAKENGRGMVFSEEEESGTDRTVSNAPAKKPMGLHAVGTGASSTKAADDLPPDDGGGNGGKSGKPSLHVVK